MRVPILVAAASLLLVAASATACSSGTKTTAAPLAGSTAASTSSTGVGGTGTSAGGTSGPVDVCSLLTAAQASAIVGVHYASATSSPNMCNYMPTNAPVGMFIIISQGAGDAAWKAELSTLQSDGGTTPKTISGVGDRAAGAGIELAVQAGDRIIDVHGGDPNSGTGVFTKSVAVAKAIISALN